MRDLIAELAEVHRTVAQENDGSNEVVRVTMSRTYATDPADLWSALTDPERIARWFMPISGDLREGGEYQLEGNASGQILVCDAPGRLEVSFGGPDSILVLTLVATTGGTRLTPDPAVPLA